MTAKLELNLGDALSSEELRELVVAAAERKQPIERLLYEAAKDLAAKLRSNRSQTVVPAVAGA